MLCEAENIYIYLYLIMVMCRASVRHIKGNPVRVWGSARYCKLVTLGRVTLVGKSQEPLFWSQNGKAFRKHGASQETCRTRDIYIFSRAKKKGMFLDRSIMTFRRRALGVLLTLHRVLGTLLSLVLLMWFVSGMVMIYHEMPQVSGKEMPHLPILKPSAADSLTVLSRDTIALYDDISLRSHKGVPVYEVRMRGGESKLIDAYTLKEVQGRTTLDEAYAIARTWCDSIASVEEVNRLEPFLPRSSYRQHFPIYKFKLKDVDRTTIYVSGQTGEVVQATTASERFWSWLGHIPHYVYFWQLRQHREAWIGVVTWVGSLGALMCLSGVVIGIIMSIKVWHRKHKLRSPYRKPYYLKWHHILGLLFGFFMCTFALSGVYSLHPLPRWMDKTVDRNFPRDVTRETPIAVTDKLYADLRAILSTEADVRGITVRQFDGQPYYRITRADGYRYVSVRDGHLAEHLITREDVEQYLSRRVRDLYTIDRITQYDMYYTGRKNSPSELPVYRVSVDNPDRYVIYIAPISGDVRVMSTAARTKSWFYPKFHNFRFGFFANHTILRQVLVWTLLLGGAVISMTGVALGFRYLCRLGIRLIRRRKG